MKTNGLNGKKEATMRATYSKLRGVDYGWTYCYDCELCDTEDCWEQLEHACDGCYFGELSINVIQEMKMKDYVFRSWHNGAGEWYYFTVEATNVQRAYDKAYDVVHNTRGLRTEVEFVSASVTTYSVTVPDLDLVLEVHDTLAQAEKFVQDAIEWDKQHPQSYTPWYKIVKNEPTRKEVR